MKKYTLFEIFNFLSIIQLFEKLAKIRENVAVLPFLTVDNFNFMRKIVEKLSGKHVKM